MAKRWGGGGGFATWQTYSAHAVRDLMGYRHAVQGQKAQHIHRGGATSTKNSV